MNTDLLSKFGTRIEQALSVIEMRAASMRNDLLQIAEDQPPVLRDELDHAKEEAELTTRLELNEHNYMNAAALRVAFAKIVHGTFGQCEWCEEDISLRRLEAHPTARLCVKCQSGQEGAIAARAHPSSHYRSPPITGCFGRSVAWLHAVGET